MKRNLRNNNDVNDEKLAIEIKNLLAENRRDWRVAAAKATTRRILLLGLGTALAVTGIFSGYLLYVVHASTSITGALVRSPLLIFIEGLALLFFRESRLDHADAKQYLANADHALHLLVQFLLFWNSGDQAALLAYARNFGNQVERPHPKPPERDRQRKTRIFPQVLKKEFEEGIQ
jgi:hypothetical protein